jgi:hypothetical protein
MAAHDGRHRLALWEAPTPHEATQRVMERRRKTFEEAKLKFARAYDAGVRTI